MLAYGDDSFQIGLGGFLDAFEYRLSTSATTLEEARLRLIFAGQLQQGVEDEGLRCAEACRHLTTVAADLFVQALDGSTPRDPRQKLVEAVRALRDVAAAEAHLRLRLKTPEGFAWYSLYPDAYVQAARSWAETHPASHVLVVGVRSIGTALAAVVAATLRCRGVRVDVCTLRPTGHPFQREARLRDGIGRDAEYALVVDEGPGLSGSSMASVAEVLSARGFSERTISFFPGHLHGPGRQSSDWVRRWWTSVCQVAVPWDKLEVGAHSTTERLAGCARDALERPLQGDLIDIGAGKWRAHCTGATRPMLGVAPLFEQPKYLAHSSTGEAVVLKFSGLSLASTGPDGTLQSAAEHQLARLHILAEAGFTPPPLRSIDSWILLPWINGRRLTAHDARDPMLRHIATYIARSAEGALPRHEAEAALGRLRSILLTNTGELLGQTAASRIDQISDILASEILNLDVKSYGDGRLAPHEWIDTGDAILKVDAAGHTNDHTAVGRQTLLWDVAGTAVDWELEHAVSCELAVAAGLRDTSSRAISYYCAAYAAFRAGLAEYSASAGQSTADRDELLMARARYTERLRNEFRRMDTFLPKRAYIKTDAGQAT